MRTQLPLLARLDVREARWLRVFGVQLVGNALAPRFNNGDVLRVDATRQNAAGDAVLASVRREKRLGCFFLNGDGDLVDNAGGYVARGEYQLLGVIVDDCPSG